MADSEHTITDVQGQYVQVVASGRQVDDATWESCRIVLTNERVAFVAETETTVPLSAVDSVGETFEGDQQVARVGRHLALHAGEDVFLVRAADQDAFETDVYAACLDGATLHVKHPAVEGGVVQSTEWREARVEIRDDVVRFVLADGTRVDVARDDIGEVAVERRQAVGEERPVVEVEHSEGATSVETHVTGADGDVSLLAQVLEDGFEQNSAELDLGPVETQVVMALHSGVSPFAIPDFVGADVAEVEGIYDRLAALDVVEVVRERTEVEMTAQGRSMAGQSRGEQ